MGSPHTQTRCVHTDSGLCAVSRGTVDALGVCLQATHKNPPFKYIQKSQQHVHVRGWDLSCLPDEVKPYKQDRVQPELKWKEWATTQRISKCSTTLKLCTNTFAQKHNMGFESMYLDALLRQEYIIKKVFISFNWMESQSEAKITSYVMLKTRCKLLSTLSTRPDCK